MESNSYRRLRYEGSRGRRCQVFWLRKPRILEWDWWSRSVSWVYCPFCQCSQAVPEKNWNCFGCGSPDHLVKLLEGPQQDCQKTQFKCKRGDDKEGRWEASETSSHSTSIPEWGSQSLKTSQKAPFLNPNPLTQWSGPENIVWVKIDGESSWALLNSCLIINVVTPEFVEVCSLDVGPLSDLSDGTLGINGFRGIFSWPLGYIITRAQVEGISSYNEDQVALVIPDSTGFGSWVLVTLGTPTINRIINVIKEKDINELLVSLSGLRIAQLLACWQAELSTKK